MERMQTREHIEFPIEYSGITNITALIRIDRDVLIALVTLLIS